MMSDFFILISILTILFLFIGIRLYHLRCGGCFSNDSICCMPLLATICIAKQRADLAHAASPMMRC